MKRELKFRAWNHNEGAMVYSDSPPSFAFWKWVGYDERDLDSLMQYTGIKDKNGKEIYEGDICKTHDWEKQPNGSTILSDKYKYDKYVVIEYKTKTPFCGYAIHGWYEVVGNIYENVIITA